MFTLSMIIKLYIYIYIIFLSDFLLMFYFGRTKDHHDIGHHIKVTQLYDL